MSICRIISCVVGRGHLQWPMHSLGKNVSLCPASFCTPKPSLPVILVSLDFLHLHSNPLWWKGHFFTLIVLEAVVGLQRIGQLKLLYHKCLGHRLGLLWCWMVCLGNEPRSYHWLSGHEFEQTRGDNERLGSLVCYSSWSHRESDTTWRLNSNNKSRVYIRVHSWCYTSHWF